MRTAREVAAEATPSPEPSPAPAPTLRLDTIKMDGYLEKKGKMRVMTTWKRYWFVLEGRLLLYYKSQEEYARLSPCRGSINMGLASCVRPGAGLADNHVLEVVLRSHVVALRAKDRFNQEQWLKALLDSMAPPSSTSASGKDSGNGKGFLHFRYPSVDNLNKAEHESLPDETVAVNREKIRTLPNWVRSQATEPTPGKSTAKDTPDAPRENSADDYAPKKSRACKMNPKNLARQGSILPILNKNEKIGSPRAVHPLEESEHSTAPFGSQRYSFHGFRKVEDVSVRPASSTKSKDSSRVLGKSKGFKGFENVLRKQLSFTSPSSGKDVTSPAPKDIKGTQILEEVLKTPNCCLSQKLNCQFCRRLLSPENGECLCQKRSTPIYEEEKENLTTWKVPHNVSRKFPQDENQNQLFRDSSFEIKRMAVSLDRNYSGSEKDLLVSPGVDLSILSPDKQHFLKPVRCTSADDLWLPPRKNRKDVYLKHKFDHMSSDAHYFSASDIDHPSNTLQSHMSEPIGSEKTKLVKVSLRQRLIHGDGEYIKCSQPEDCDKRDLTINTSLDTTSCHVKEKPKTRLRKRKGSSTKDSYKLADNFENGNKKRVPVRNRLSFLTRVLSHVRRTKSEDIMDHPESVGVFSDDAFISPHPDTLSKCTTPVGRMLDDVKKIEDACSGSNPTLRANFQLGPTNSVFDEAPEEPPPDYDSVGMDTVTKIVGNSADDEPPELPPRRMKRPRSPWHDVPTNNSPIGDDDNEARQRLLSAAKYGRVIGTRISNSSHCYEWSESRQSDHSQHHAYEVVSDDTSSAGSNEHLAIYLSSESSDDEFHEQVVLRRKNLEDGEFLFGSQTNSHPFGSVRNSSVMEPLTICTDTLPTLDSCGKVGLSHVEAMKLNLLMQAQRTSTELLRKHKEEYNKQDVPASPFLTDLLQTQNFYNPSTECLQLPPKEFADDDDFRLTLKPEITQHVMAEIQGLLSPADKLIKSCQETNMNGKSEEASNEELAIQLQNSQTENFQNKLSDLPPQLPTKKMKEAEREKKESTKVHSDELNHLLAQLAGMTTAPLLPVGATCSLQMDVLGLDREALASSHQEATIRKQSLSLEAVGNNYDSEPDYDVPRPHVSLVHMLPRTRRPLFPSGFGDDDELAVKATHFLSRPESPRCGFVDDQNWNGGNISPDSLDFPFTPRHPLNWDYSYSSRSQDKNDSNKRRGKKDRSRRATLNGPIIKPAFESYSSSPTCQRSALVRRNSMDLPQLQNDCNKHLDIEKDRGMSEPKQIKKLSAYDVATCEHNLSPVSSFTQNNENIITSLCKKANLSSLEDIHEKFELNLDSVTIGRSTTGSSGKVALKADEVDMDSLEVSELRRVDLTLGTGVLVSIIEEPDMFSDKSDLQAEEVVCSSSGSSSEVAVMMGNSDTSGTGLQMSDNTDTDIEMPSDNESSHLEVGECINDADSLMRIIEPDSLLQDTVAEKDLEDSRNAAEIDSAKDVSLEIDSLELKK